MDPRRLLTPLAAALVLSGCALGRAPAPHVEMHTSSAPPAPSLVSAAPAVAAPEPSPPAVSPAEPGPPPRAVSSPTLIGRPAIAAANRRARAVSSDAAFENGLQVFDWAPGRVYEVWTAPLRVTALSLEPGETVAALAAGDTVRWQIGEAASGAGEDRQGHVLVKPLEAGLETNLVLTTSRRVYLVQLLSGPAESYNAAVAWRAPPSPRPDHETAPPPVPDAFTPEPTATRYEVRARGRAPAWRPTAVFDDGRRTYIALSPRVTTDEAPALFVGAGEEAQIVNYRQAGSTLVVDRLFDRAELRGGGRRPAVIEIRRLEEAADDRR